jgi:excisionase family DNA binding protein
VNFEDQFTQLVRDAMRPMLAEALEHLEARLLARVTEVVQAQPAPVAPPKPVLTLAEVADLLQIAPRTVQRMAADGEFPAPIRLGSTRPRWRRAEIDTWLQRRAAG